MNLQEISDPLEIQDLMVEYCYPIDTRNWDALDDVFTTDAIIDYSEMVGVKNTLLAIAILEFAKRRVKPNYPDHLIRSQKLVRHLEVWRS